MYPRGSRALLALGVAAALAPACKSKPAPAAAASARTAASAAPLAALAAVVSSSQRAARKSPEDLRTPPLTPPEDAATAPNGMRIKVLNPGDGQVIGTQDAIRADFSLWTGDGKLAFTTYKGRGPGGFTATTLREDVFQEIRRVSPGGKAWFWFPAELVQSIAQAHPAFPFPKTALILEYEPVASEYRGPSVTTTEQVGRPPPDAAGPPAAALKTENGLRYVVHTPGNGERKPAAADKLHLRLTLWPVMGLVIGRPSLLNEPSATTLARAPAGLGRVLSSLTEGATVRVWLPPGKASQVGPVDKDREGVLDLTLEKIE